MTACRTGGSCEICMVTLVSSITTYFFYGMYEVIPQKFHHLWRAVYAFRYKKKFHSVTGITCGAFFFGEKPHIYSSFCDERYLTAFIYFRKILPSRWNTLVFRRMVVYGTSSPIRRRQIFRYSSSACEFLPESGSP